MKKKMVGFIFSVLLINTIYPLPALAAGNVSVYEYEYNFSENSIVPYADVIQTKYRIHNGVPQYRRWNSTKNRWVDPHWINMN